DLFPYHFLVQSEWILMSLAARRDPPFDRGRAPAPEAIRFRALGRIPSRVESPAPPASRLIDDRDALVVHAGTAIHLDLVAGDARIKGRFGVPLELYGGRRSSPIRVRVELRPAGGSPRTLVDRTLDPVANEADRGSQSFALEGLPAPPGEIVLHADLSGGAPSARSWAY